MPYKPTNTDKQFNLVEPNFGTYKAMKMAMLNCTAISSRNKAVILREFNINMIDSPDQFELVWNEKLLAEAMLRYAPKEGATQQPFTVEEIKSLFEEIIKEKIVSQAPSEKYGIEGLMLKYFHLLFIKSKSNEFKDIKADDLNMNQINRAASDFFSLASGD